MVDYQEPLRRLTLHDERALDDALAGRCRDSTTALEARIQALVRLAALVGSGGPPTSYSVLVDAARVAGATPEDLVETLLAVAPIVGSAKVVDAAPKLALGLGYDVEEDLQALSPR